jgi:hypothetical protein
MVLGLTQPLTEMSKDKVTRLQARCGLEGDTIIALLMSKSKVTPLQAQL